MIVGLVVMRIVFFGPGFGSKATRGAPGLFSTTCFLMEGFSALVGFCFRGCSASFGLLSFASFCSEAAVSACCLWTEACLSVSVDLTEGSAFKRDSWRITLFGTSFSTTIFSAIACLTNSGVGDSAVELVFF